MGEHLDTVVAAAAAVEGGLGIVSRLVQAEAGGGGRGAGSAARPSPLADYLRTGSSLLGIDLGLVARVDGERLVVRASTDPHLDRGTVVRLAGTPAADVVATDATVAREATDARFGAMAVRTWLGTPVRSDGTTYVLAFAAPTPRDRPFEPAEVAAVEFMADALALYLRASEAEEAQRRSESTNRAILAALPDLLFRYDRRGIHLGGWAGRPEDLFRPLDRVIGRPVADVLPPHLAEMYEEAIRATLEDGALQTVRYAGVLGGEVRHFEARLVPCAADEVLAIVRNVTDTVRAGEALAAEARLAALVAEVATDLQAAPKCGLDAAIIEGLGRVGRHLGASTATLGEDTGDGGVRCGHDWRSIGGARTVSAVSSHWGWLSPRLDRDTSVLVTDGGGDGPGPGLWVRIGAPDAGRGGVVGFTWPTSPPTLAGAAIALVRVFGEALVGALARHRAEAVADGQASVLEVIATGAPLPSALAAVSRLVERNADDLRAAVLLVGEDGRSLRVGAAPSLPAAFGGDAHHLPLDDDAPWSLAVETARPVIAGDVTADPRFRGCAVLAAHAGIGSVWAVPIVSARTGRVLGALATAGAAGRLPSPTEWQLQEAGAALAAIAVERAAEEATLAFQATHCSLTKVANRTVLLDRLEVALARAQRSGRPVTLLFCDLDRFKGVNDRFGHDLGDALLVAVAERLTAIVRPTDTVARVGGDEFVVLCEEAPAVEDAMALAERVAAAIEGAPFPIGTTEVAITVSIGIAVSADEHDHPEALLRDADEAMYRAKAGGRARRELFEERIRRDARRRARLAEDLTRAVDAGQLLVHYQPVVSFRDGRMRGAEALLRWRHPERGLLQPDDFVPLAEATGLIVPIGRWLLGVALDQLADWARSDPELAGRLGVHVNVSARQLVEQDFVPMVRDGLARTGLHASALCLEITESVLMDDTPATTAAIEALTELGVRLALDDFGTGYASLTYLRAFPVDALKVDRSFVSGLGQGGDDEAIVAAVVDLAHALGLEAVAEGVETDEQLRCLLGLGCDGAQGFRFARPGPAEALADSLSRRFL